MKHTLINKHVLEALKEIPDESIDCIVTSPPYYGLRLYKGAETVWGEWEGQLGLEPSYQLYLDHLMLVTKELKRVLKKTGTLFWNMGDTYSGAGAGQKDTGKASYEGSDFRPSPVKSNLPDKSLMMLPERFTIRMIDDGWVLRNKIIWYKRNGMPSSVKDRFSNKYEFIYFFAKDRKYYFDLDAVRKPLEESSIRRLSEKNLDNQFQTGKVAEFALLTGTGNMKKALINLRNKSFNIRVRDIKKGILKDKWGNLYSASEQEINTYNEKEYVPKKTKHDEAINRQGRSYEDPLHHPHETVEFFRQKGQGGNYDYNGLDSENGNHYNSNGANPGDVLDAPTMPHKFAHFTVYPERLVEPLIRAGCSKDGVVLDPFAGSGTTGVVAKSLGRSSIMIEISPEYCKIIKERMNWGSGFDIEWVMNNPIEEVMVG
jgi:DNA modification methylase